jgi:hypothetical protein
MAPVAVRIERDDSWPENKQAPLLSREALGGCPYMFLNVTDILGNCIIEKLTF